MSDAVTDMAGIHSAWLTIERFSILLGMLGLAFAAGQNWHRLDGLENGLLGLSRDQDRMKADYERKDVLEERLKGMDVTLQDIRQQLQVATRELQTTPMPRRP